MQLEIVTPEAVVLQAEVDAVKVPGANGEFQMLNDHAPIVSTLTEGEVEISLTTVNRDFLEDLSSDFRKGGEKVLYYPIKGGVLEMKDNQAIILAD
ncbi:F0F1 ATP synthase subunit epsilon [Salegentibacter sediminis]|uniref:F0F1 ATP synthase subunit epsilon n=1 Tax=Salegentibacter sediminis TaxID=1930251 RepID=UPI0009C0C447|nr:F0F1 ATP synthase subunit epsilon [Salegentibacter sediminis]